MVETMVTTPTWTLRSWRGTMEKQLDSWMMYIPGMSGSTEVKMLKNFKCKLWIALNITFQYEFYVSVLLDTMTPDELDEVKAVDGPARERIAAKTQQDPDEISKLLFYFRQTKVLALWLQLK